MSDDARPAPLARRIDSRDRLGILFHLLGGRTHTTRERHVKQRQTGPVV
jgi:hypothetical protein